MKMNRRFFLGAAATSPFTAREAAEAAIAEAQRVAQMEAGGISTYSDSLYTSVAVPDETPTTRGLWDFIRDVGMPDWKKQDLMEDARRSRTLDPDIASLRSVSLSRKMQMQWDRNYRILVERAHAHTRMERMKRTFFDANPDVTEY
ncbi:MAG: hypothetical protein ACK5JT_15260 [Hyphomicrobiaceae bacterium]